MERNELLEWIVMILAIVAWWPKIFFGFDAAWYMALIYGVTPLVLVAILIVRHRRMQEGFAYSKEVIDAQHNASGKNVLGKSDGPVSPYPGVPMPPDTKSGDEDK